MSQKSYDGTPTVYLIPTPIGNLDDITLRSIKVLKSVEVIFSEDTRVTALLLKHLDISKKLISSHKFNESENKNKLIEYLKNGYDVGIVSDRGTPVISDPGYELAKFAIINNYNVVGLPGATALIPALIMSGINPMPFLFYGFLDHKEGKRKKELQSLNSLSYTLIFYEAPHRLEKTLAELLDRFGNIEIVIAKELTKIHESFIRGRIEDILPTLKDVKGEYIILFEMHSKTEKQIEVETLNQMTLEEQYKYYENQGMNKKDIIKRIAKNNKVPKDEIYKKFI